MYLDQNFTKIMLTVIVICTGIVKKFYSAYLFGVSPNFCINVFIDIHLTSALIFIFISINVHTTTSSTCIEIRIIDILPITASPNPLHQYPMIFNQNLYQHLHHRYFPNNSITRPLYINIPRYSLDFCINLH